MFITIGEIISLAIITLVLGYIFADYLSGPRLPWAKPGKRWKDIRFAALIIAPAVIVHELFHKFVGMSFGFPAIVKVFWGGLGLALALKLLSSPLLIIAPAYVVYPAIATPFQSMLIAFAGPFANLLMWIGATLWLKYGKIRRKTALILALTRKINLFLLVFNMIPVPPLDGFHVVKGLFGLF